jgi:hypothetical protein
VIVLGLTAAPASAVRLQSVPLLDLLPPAPEGGSWFSVTAQGTRSLEEHAATFTDADEATTLLVDWGWQENAFRLIEDSRATGTESPVPYLYMSLTRFDDADGAAAAMPYIVQDLIAGEGHQEVPVGSPVGDEARALVVPAQGGTDFTLYVRADSLIMRISVLLNDDDPIADPEQVAETIITRMSMPAAPTVPARSMLPALLTTLPPDLPSCLQLHGEEVFDFPALVERFPMIPDAAEPLTTLGWEAGSYRQFTCDVAPVSGLNWVDMSVHQFGDAASAAEAAPYFAHARTVCTQLTEAPVMALGDASAAIGGPSELGSELTLYVSTGRLLLRVTGIATNDDPRPATELVMTALYVHNLSDSTTDRAPQSIVAPTSVPQRPSPTPLAPPPPQSSITDQIDCMRTPSQCSLHDGVADWTSPAYGCDWNYATTRAGCVPAEQGDYDCPDLHAMGLWDIRVIGEDWMLLDEDGDGVGCELTLDALEAEAARCKSLYEPERAACFDILEEQFTIYEELNREPDPDYGDQYDDDEALDPPPDTDYCDENICR